MCRSDLCVCIICACTNTLVIVPLQNSKNKLASLLPRCFQMHFGSAIVFANSDCFSYAERIDRMSPVGKGILNCTSFHLSLSQILIQQKPLGKWERNDTFPLSLRRMCHSVDGFCRFCSPEASLSLFSSTAGM